MARFLSPRWFDELRAGPPATGPGPAARPELVLEVVVAGAPDDGAPDDGGPGGKVRYQVAVGDGGAVVLTGPAADRTPQVGLRADYEVLAGIASGRLSALEVMAGGRARLTGNTAALSAHQLELESLDLVSPAVRASTTF